MVTTKNLFNSIQSHILSNSNTLCILKELRFFFSFRYAEVLVILTFLDCILSLNPCTHTMR